MSCPKCGEKYNIIGGTPKESSTFTITNKCKCLSCGLEFMEEYQLERIADVYTTCKCGATTYDSWISDDETGVFKVLKCKECGKEHFVGYRLNRTVTV